MRKIMGFDGDNEIVYRTSSVRLVKENGSDIPSDCSNQLINDVFLSRYARLYYSAYFSLLGEELPICIFATAISTRKSMGERRGRAFQDEMLDLKRLTFLEKNGEIGNYNLITLMKL